MKTAIFECKKSGQKVRLLTISSHTMKGSFPVCIKCGQLMNQTSAMEEADISTLRRFNIGVTEE